MYLQTIGIHGMFLNVATFSVTNRSICSTKKNINFFFTFLPDILLTAKLSANFGAPSIKERISRILWNVFDFCRFVAYCGTKYKNKGYVSPAMTGFS
jgi:hypothetical protein